MKRTLVRILLYLLLLTAPLYWLDQWSKNWIVAEFADPDLRSDSLAEEEKSLFFLAKEHSDEKTEKVWVIGPEQQFLDEQTPLKLFQIKVIDGFFNLVRVHNRGVAFGKFSGWKYANWFFGILSSSVLLVVLFLWIRGKLGQNWLSAVAVSLLICGILGNLTDRLKHGYVVDFLDFHIGENHWPSFNVADSCICVAAVLLFVTTLREEKKQARNQARLA